MAIAKVICKMRLSAAQRQQLHALGVQDIATDNPLNKNDSDEIIHRIGAAEAIIVSVFTPINEYIIQQCKNLKFIQTWSTGLNHIDLNAAQAANIIVKNVENYSTNAIAEKTLAFMVFMANNLRDANQYAIQGHWDYTKFLGTELNGKTLGIIGRGKIGQRVANLADAFAMQVQLVSSSDKNAINTLCSQADFITLHCPLATNTYHLLNHEEFTLMKSGVYLLNAARGGLINEMALLKALDNGKVAYAWLDVLELEPPAAHYALLQHPRILLTPHIAWNTKEANQQLTDQCINNLKDYLLSVADSN